MTPCNLARRYRQFKEPTAFILSVLKLVPKAKRVAWMLATIYQTERHHIWDGNYVAALEVLNSTEHQDLKLCLNFLDVLAYSRKAPISLRMYPCCCHWMDFHEIWHWGLTWKSVLGNSEFILKSGTNIGHFTWRIKYFLLLPATQIRHKHIFVQHSVLLHPLP